MKTRAIIVLIITWILLLLIGPCKGQSRIVYSWLMSAQVRHAVDNEKPKVTSDTLQIGTIPPYTFKVKTTYTYPNLRIEIVRDRKPEVGAYSGDMQIMLKPDDEYAVLEKLLPLVK